MRRRQALRWPLRVERLKPFCILTWLLLCSLRQGLEAQQEDLAQEPVESTSIESASPVFESPVEVHQKGVEQRIVDVYRAASDAVVQVNASMKNKRGDARPAQMNVSSGFFIDHKGTVLTTALVTEQSERIWVFHKNKAYVAESHGVDPYSGLALLKISDPPKIKSPIEVQEPVLSADAGRFAISLAGYKGLPPVMNTRQLTGETNNFPPSPYLILNAPCAKGEAGSPVLNLNGELIGMLMGNLSETNLSLSLPTKAIMRIKSDFERYEEARYAWLGIQAHFDTEADAVVVDKAEPDSPASEFGIKLGDKILRIADIDIASIGDLNYALFFARVGQTLPIRLLRKNEELFLSVVPQERAPHKNFVNSNWKQPVGNLDLKDRKSTQSELKKPSHVDSKTPDVKARPEKQSASSAPSPSRGSSKPDADAVSPNVPKEVTPTEASARVSSPPEAVHSQETQVHSAKKEPYRDPHLEWQSSPFYPEDNYLAKDLI